jgi:hypothetical protein
LNKRGADKNVYLSNFVYLIKSSQRAKKKNKKTKKTGKRENAEKHAANHAVRAFDLQNG